MLGSVPRVFGTRISACLSLGVQAMVKLSYKTAFCVFCFHEVDFSGASTKVCVRG